MSVEGTVLSLQISPSNAASEEIVKLQGSNPKNIMRLLNTEPVSKLHDYLAKKWRVGHTNADLVLYCRGVRMVLSDPLSVYQETSVSYKLPLEYDISHASDETATTSSTPTGSPEPASKVDSILQEIQNLASPPNSAAMAPSALGQGNPFPSTDKSSYAVENQQSTIEKLLSVAEKPASKPSPRKTQAPKPVRAEPVPSVVAYPPVVVKEAVQAVASAHPVTSEVSPPVVRPSDHSAEENVALVPRPELPLPLSIPAAVDTFSTHDSRIEAIYKDVLEKERDIFMTILDSQARWLSQLQSQMMSTVLAMHSRGYSSCEEEGTPNAKKVRKQPK